MKLKNKKTGEIVKFETDIYVDAEDITYEFSSLAKLNEEWEDYEEPKEYWFIDTILNKIRLGSDKSDEEWIRFKSWSKEIGNYFETIEEAEKAVEKLKAIKSLKDKGFKFTGWELRASEPGLVIKANCVPDSVNELDILFRGEYEAKE